MKVDFLIAEEVRLEAQSKLTILGLFAGGIIILNKSAQPKEVPGGVQTGLERLAIVAIISGAPEGLLKFKGRIVQPSGELYQPESALGEGMAKQGYSNTVVVELKPFIVKEMGSYKFEFFVDEQMYPFSFEIREQF